MIARRDRFCKGIDPANKIISLKNIWYLHSIVFASNQRLLLRSFELLAWNQIYVCFLPFHITYRGIPHRRKVLLWVGIKCKLGQGMVSCECICSSSIVANILKFRKSFTLKVFGHKIFKRNFFPIIPV